MPTYYEQEFRSTDLNAPPMMGLVGAVPAVLNQCLVNGYDFTFTPSSATRSGATITVTLTAAQIAKIKVGSILTMSGATGGDASLYNVTHTVVTVPSTTTYTWTAAGTPGANATGTLSLTAKLSITSITRGGTGNLTATAVLTSVNTTLRAGDYIVVQGCTGTGAAVYNNTAAQLTSVANSATTTTITWQMASDPGANASGSPTYYKAGLQWTNAAAAGTNSHSWVCADTTGVVSDTYTPRPLQCVDNAITAGLGKEAQFWGYESIVSDQNGTNLFPTVAQMASGTCLRKSLTADSVNRAWSLYGNGKRFILEVQTGDPGVGYGIEFGYVVPTTTGDAYNTMIAGGFTFNAASSIQGCNIVSALGTTPVGATHACWMPRLYNQAGTSVLAAVVGIGTAGAVANSAGGGVLTYPHPPDRGLYTQKFYIADSAGVVRGRIPGRYGALHINPLTHNDTTDNAVGLTGRTLRNVSVQTGNGSQGQMLIDLTGPWD